MILGTTKDLQKYVTEVGEKTGEDVLIGSISELPSEIKDNIRIVLTYGVYPDRLFEEELKQLKNVQWIQVMSSGIDELPLGYMKERKILITTAKGIHSIPISEYVFGMLLYYSKKINEFRVFQERKTWASFIELNELHGKTIGIFGTGHIGRAIAEKAKVFGMHTIGLNRRGTPIKNFDQVYAIDEIKSVVNKLDYICSVLPSNSQSRGLVNKELIDLMKDGVIFINVGRGDLLVEEDFIEALKSQKIKWAVLDVFDEEPLAKNHPFWNISNLMITPHASAVTNMYIKRCLNIFYHNYNCFAYGNINQMINKLD